MQIRYFSPPIGKVSFLLLSFLVFGFQKFNYNKSSCDFLWAYYARCWLSFFNLLINVLCQIEQTLNHCFCTHLFSSGLSPSSSSAAEGGSSVSAHLLASFVQIRCFCCPVSTSLQLSTSTVFSNIYLTVFFHLKLSFTASSYFIIISYFFLCFQSVVAAL